MFSSFAGPCQDVPASTFGSSGCMLHVPKCCEDFSSLGQYPVKMSHLLTESMCYVPKCYQDVSSSPHRYTSAGCMLCYVPKCCQEISRQYPVKMAHLSAGCMLCVMYPSVKMSHLSTLPGQHGPSFGRIYITESVDSIYM